jgi:hypothetical protein
MSDPGTAWTTSLDEPFRSSTAFSRSVAASADALLLTVLATIVGVALRLNGAGPWTVALPFIGPLVMLASALLAARAFRRGVVAEPDGSGRSWRDQERQAVARVFGPALVRNRLPH